MLYKSNRKWKVPVKLLMISGKLILKLLKQFSTWNKVSKVEDLTLTLYAKVTNSYLKVSIQIIK